MFGFGILGLIVLIIVVSGVLMMMAMAIMHPLGSQASYDQLMDRYTHHGQHQKRPAWLAYVVYPGLMVLLLLGMFSSKSLHLNAAHNVILMWYQQVSQIAPKLCMLLVIVITALWLQLLLMLWYSRDRYLKYQSKH